jgi:hypothetical protein
LHTLVQRAARVEAVCHAEAKPVRETRCRAMQPHPLPVYSSRLVLIW